MDYREFGGEQTLRPPGRFERTQFYYFLVRADGARLAALCDRYLNLDPTGAVSYRPLGPYVLVAFTAVPKLAPADAAAKGWFDYRDIAIWVPVLGGRRGAPPWECRLRLFPPYIFVDDAYTMATGREVFGLPKQLGRFQMPADPLTDAPFRAEVVGVRAPGEENAWHPLFTVERGAARAHADDAGRPLRERLLALLAGVEGLVDHAGLDLGALAPAMGAVGLKQLRGADGGDRAVYQAVVEALLTPTAIHALLPLPFDYRFTLHPLASHPVAAQLGLRDGPQDVALAFYVDADITMTPGEVMWPAAAAATVTPAPAPAAAAAGGAARQRVAVLGGGIAGLTAALELTRTEERRRAHEVTVYLPGWRLGGKGASGRNAAAADRIEEHGLHVWFGFYENAFRLIQGAYAELGRSWRDGFTPQQLVVVSERFRDRWVKWHLLAPPTPGTPGDGTPPVFFEIIGGFLRWLEGHAIAELGHERFARLVGRGAEHRGAIGSLFERLAHLGATVAEDLLGAALRLAGGPTGRDVARELGAMVSLVAAMADRVSLLGDLEDDDGLRRIFLILDTFAAMLRGILEDRVFEPPYFAKLDALDFREWLRRHGAHPLTLDESPSVRFIYNAAFAFEDGDVTKARFAAGTALRGVLRLLGTYKEAALFRMTAGMGDVVFAPIYEVLRARGVRFRFFHAVDHVGLTADRTAVERVDLTRQVRLRDGVDEYRPLVEVNGLACWPSRPLPADIVDGERLLASGLDLEAPGAAFEPSRVTLRAGRDFDELVLAIPVAVLPSICAELIAASPRWQRMVREVKTVRTQAWQLWMTRSLEELGWPRGSDPPDQRPLTGTYIDPVDTYCDMTHLLPRERWPAELGVKSVAYFCGVQDDRDGEDHAAATRRAGDYARVFFEEDSDYLWPNVRRPTYARAIDWDALVDPERRRGPARFDFQYTRANTWPSERYTLSLPGTIDARLAADASGFGRLVLAGDWIDNGFNAGCIEATVMSGLQAARAVLGGGVEVIGDTDAWFWGH